MLDGLKVNYYNDNDNGRSISGVIIQSQIIGDHNANSYLRVAIMNKAGDIVIRDWSRTYHAHNDIEIIFNNPMEVISDINKAKQVDSIKERFAILDLRE